MLQVSLHSFKVSLSTSSHFSVRLLEIYASIDTLPLFLCFLSLEYASKSFCKYLFISPALKLPRQVTLNTQLGTEHWKPRCSKSLISVFVCFLYKTSLHHFSSLFTLCCTASLFFAWNCVHVAFNYVTGEVQGWKLFHLFLQFDKAGVHNFSQWWKRFGFKWR